MGLFDDEASKAAGPLKTIRAYLAMAIQIGAPAYNHGDVRGCYDVYACTARLLLRAIEGADDDKQVLRTALERCAALSDVNEQAWIMRRAFDAILDSGDRN